MKTYPKRQQTVNLIPEEERAMDVDRMFAFVNDDRDFVLVQYYTFDKLLKDVNYYVAGNPIQLKALISRESSMIFLRDTQQRLSL